MLRSRVNFCATPLRLNVKCTIMGILTIAIVSCHLSLSDLICPIVFGCQVVGRTGSRLISACHMQMHLAWMQAMGHDEF